MEKDKKFTVVWSESAQDYFTNLALSIEANDKSGSIVDRIISKIDILQESPSIGKIDQIWSNKVVSFRQLEVHPYKVIFHINYKNTTVYIDYVLDTRKLVAG